MKTMTPLTLSVALLVTMIAASVAVWFAISPGTELAVHFGLDGTPNSYAPAPFALSIIPLAALVATLVFAIAPRFDRKVRDFPVRYIAVWLFVITVLAVGHFMIVGHALVVA